MHQKHALKASQDQTEGRLYLSGSVFTAVCGYQVDKHSITLFDIGNGIMQLSVDITVPPGRESFPVLGGKNKLPVTIGVDHPTWVRVLRVIIGGTSVDLDVQQLNFPEPTD